MEKSLERSMDETFRIPGVAGVLCADEHGLCLSAKGIAQKDASGQLSSLAKQAQQLHSSITPGPIVVIEGEGGSILVKSDSDVTMALYKSPTS